MKVAVGMSGGVDSSVAALLLKEKGYDVIGIFMRNWDSALNNDVKGNPNFTDEICPQEQDYNDALKVCEKLEIPLFRVDFVKEYWENVFQYFLDELKKGRTPNPDIMCNKYIKFDAFLKHAEKLGADFVATGHYARIVDGKLLRGMDENKDQTYFLSQVSKENFKKILFPIGWLSKDEVRKIAVKNNLETAKKKDSTGICFIGERNFKKFLENYLPNKEGEIYNVDNNEVVGEHSGLMYYTIGQRRGLHVGGTSERLFVVGKDLEKNRLLVSMGSESDFLYSNEAIIEDVNWISDTVTNKCAAKFRYRQKDNEVEIIEKNGSEYRIKYNSVKSVTPGQACVFYLEEECLGGGIIKEVFKDGKKLKFV